MHPFLMRRPKRKEITEAVEKLQDINKKIEASQPAPSGKFQIFCSGLDDQWYFHLKSRNGKVILMSEGYKQKHMAIKAVNRIIEITPSATVVVDDLS